MALKEYERKRDFNATPEPKGRKPSIKSSGSLRFVIQKHDATRLHYDFRLETRDGMLKSWAVPKGISLDPKVKRLAVLTEDHPIGYLDFEGVIPEGNYGAGTVIVWDIGTYSADVDIQRQFQEGKIKFTLFGKKVNGAFSLVRMKENQWLLTKSSDEHNSDDDIEKDMPESVLTGRTNDELGKKKHRDQPVGMGKSAAFPALVRPMLATAIDKPFDSKDWVFEVKWDGVRSIVFWNKSADILEIRSRSDRDMTHRYPEIVEAIYSAANCNNSVVLDGEIVVLNSKGIPDFQLHQRRMNVDHPRDVEYLAHNVPATYYVFDILYLDGQSLEELPFIERRRILKGVVANTGRIQVSDYVEEFGTAFFKSAIRMGLEGIVAKQKDSKYLQGTRSSGWLKIKGILTQDCIVIGYTRGEGNRERYFGSLILAAYDKGKLRFIGHTGSGFGYDQLKDTLKMLQKFRVDYCPIDHVPYVNREPVWTRPELVAEVKFAGWTRDGNMRAPIFLRFREDKRLEECTVEQPEDVEDVIQTPTKSQPFSNLDKVFWNATASHGELKKKHLIGYYDSISRFILPHLKDRPLSLSRYPDGTLGKSFYHKNWDQAKPDYAKSIRVFSESSNRIINYLMCNNRETLLWLANVGCIEMHPWYSRVQNFGACAKEAEGKNAQDALDEDWCGLATPDFIIFDLDPYIYSGKERQGQEPEYNTKGFDAAVQVALYLKDLLNQLKIRSYVKTSGRTGLHVFVPVVPKYNYDQARTFAEVIGKILRHRHPGEITMEWSTAARKGKVFFDHNQNAKGKTVASVYSARPTLAATVSMPVAWERLTSVIPTDFTILDVPEIMQKSDDPWKDILKGKQDIGELLESVTELH